MYSAFSKIELVSDNWISIGSLFQFSVAAILKAWRPKSVLYWRISSNGWCDDHSDVDDDGHWSFIRLWSYDSIDIFLTLYVMTLSLKVIRRATESQCSGRIRGLARESLGTCSTTRDKEFCPLWSFAKFRLDVLCIRELQQSRRVVTILQASVRATSSDSNRRMWGTTPIW